MDNAGESEIKVAELRGQVAMLLEEIAHMRLKVSALESLAGVDKAEIKRLGRLLVEATYGAEARRNGPSTNARAIDKA